MKKENMIWSALLHLGTNMWRDKDAPIDPDDIHRFRDSHVFWCDDLRFDLDVFHRITEKLPGMGVNTLLIDVGDGVHYDSHPEIGVNGALTPDELRAEVRRLRSLGLEPVPKLNFASSHDAWLGQYERMLSTDIYRAVVGDLIHEVCEIFEKPKYLHLGMDEENERLQRNFDIAVIRQHDLWWHDLYYFVECVEKNNARAWVWSDYIWNHTEEYLAKMPKTVVQNNWYYSNQFENADEKYAARLKSFELLDKHGFDQVPAGSTFSYTDNFELLTKYSKEHVSPEHLIGMMHTVWERIDNGWMDKHKLAEKNIADAKKWFENN